MDPWLQAATIGLLGLLLGLGFVFYGFKLFLILLPIWGFFFGFLFGAGLVTALFSDGFLATVTGWVVGFFVGLLFAVLSYLFYWFAVLFIGASVGYAIGLGLLALLGNGGDNLMGLIFGLVGAAIGAGLVVVLRVPKYLIIALTAIGWRDRVDRRRGVDLPADLVGRAVDRHDLSIPGGQGPGLVVGGRCGRPRRRGHRVPDARDRPGGGDHDGLLPQSGLALIHDPFGLMA